MRATDNCDGHRFPVFLLDMSTVHNPQPPEGEGVFSQGLGSPYRACGLYRTPGRPLPTLPEYRQQTFGGCGSPVMSTEQASTARSRYRVRGRSSPLRVPVVPASREARSVLALRFRGLHHPLCVLSVGTTIHSPQSRECKVSAHQSLVTFHCGSPAPSHGRRSQPPLVHGVRFLRAPVPSFGSWRWEGVHNLEAIDCEGMVPQG